VQTSLTSLMYSAVILNVLLANFLGKMSSFRRIGSKTTAPSAAATSTTAAAVTVNSTATAVSDNRTSDQPLVPDISSGTSCNTSASPSPAARKVWGLKSWMHGGAGLVSTGNREIDDKIGGGEWLR
jgi:hypothetical protein